MISCVCSAGLSVVAADGDAGTALVSFGRDVKSEVRCRAQVSYRIRHTLVPTPADHQLTFTAHRRTRMMVIPLGDPSFYEVIMSPLAGLALATRELFLTCLLAVRKDISFISILWLRCQSLYASYRPFGNRLTRWNAFLGHCAQYIARRRMYSSRVVEVESTGVQSLVCCSFVLWPYWETLKRKRAMLNGYWTHF